MPRSDATRPRSSEAAAIISRPGYQGMLYIALLRNNTAVSNSFLLLSTRKKKQWENMEKKMKQKNICKIEENFELSLYLSANFIFLSDLGSTLNQFQGMTNKIRQYNFSKVFW